MNFEEHASKPLLAEAGIPVPPARLHFYDQGEDGFRLVGVERPQNDAAPLSR